MEYAEIRLREADKLLAAFENKNYLYSEKLDGWHVIWDGKGKLFTKSGKMTLPAPAWFQALLPVGTAVSAELVLRGEQATDVARLRAVDGPWDKARLYVFDLPCMRSAPFSERTRLLKQIVTRQCAAAPRGRKCALRYIEQKNFGSVAAFRKDFDSIVKCTGKYKADGPCFGEGVVITRADSLYEARRVDRLTRAKLKRREDAEAKVVGYAERSLVVEYAGLRFRLGIGLTSAQRDNLRSSFPLGTLVKFSFRAAGAHGKPKEARLVGIRHKDDVKD